MAESSGVFCPVTKLCFGVGLNLFATFYFPVIGVNHSKESTWISLCALHRFGLGFQDEAEHTEFDLFKIMFNLVFIPCPHSVNTVKHFLLAKQQEE